MNRSTQPRVIDLGYRPRTYFWARQHHIALPSDIKGAERRRIYTRALANGDAQALDPALHEHALSEQGRTTIGRIHPAFMGGEYLPDLLEDEVEIARIVIASTTQDVTCVYARPTATGILYRVVDEYGGSTLQGEANHTSDEPLTLDALVDLFLGAWDLLTLLDANFADDGWNPDRVHAFIVDVSSCFYPQFDALVGERVNNWLHEVRSGIDSEEEDDAGAGA